MTEGKERLTVLRKLLAAGQRSLRLADLGGGPGGDPRKIRAALDELRADGWDLREADGTIWCEAEPPWLNPDAISSHLQTCAFGRPLVVYRETTSTNDLACRAARDGAPEGYAVFAETQTAGRGQYGRRWHSPPGAGLWFSFVMRSGLPRSSHPLLVQAAAVATAETLEGFLGPVIRIKRPNDLRVDGAKLAGFLLETNAAGGWQVLGCGLNVGSAPDVPGVRTTWAARHVRRPLPSRGALAAEVLGRFERWYQRWDPEGIRAAVSARLE